MRWYAWGGGVVFSTCFFDELTLMAECNTKCQSSSNTIQYNNTISFIEDDKNKGREVSADTAATETYYMMGINKI